ELLSRCLQKDPSKRLRDIGDARLEIERTMARPEEEPARDALLPRRRAFLLYGTLALLLVVGAWLGVRVARLSGLPEKKYLAIFLKDLSGAANGQLIADGFAETVSARVGQDPRIQVVSSSAATAAREKATDPYEAAHQLHANLLVRGTFQQEGESVRFTFFVENAENRRQLLSDQIRGRKGDLFAVQDEVAEKVARCLGVAQLPPASITGLRGLPQQDLYLEALGLLQRYENTESVDQATRILQSLVGQGARSALVHSALARAHLYKYDLTKLKAWSDQAIAECERAREINGNLPEVHVTLGEVRNRTGDAQNALTEFDKALLLQPDYAAAMIGRGDAEKALGRMAEAEDSYQRAIHLQPGNWSAYNNLGRLYMLQARYEKAAEAFSRVTEVSPDNSRAFFNLGAAFFYLQRPDDARAAFERSIRLVPSGFAYSNLGTLEFSVGKYAAAAKAFEEAVKQSPSDYQLWFNLGDAYRWSPHQRERAVPAYERAIELGLQALKVNPRDAATHAMLARCFAKLGKPVEARREIERAIELEPKSPEILYKAAVTAAVAGRKHEALDWIARAVHAGYPTALIMLEPEFASLRGETDFLKAVTPKPADRSS
ncbi:MAG: tetratricopeptide repeat protein, partial [Acidobacteriota bacterium]